MTLGDDVKHAAFDFGVLIRNAFLALVVLGCMIGGWFCIMTGTAHGWNPLAWDLHPLKEPSLKTLGILALVGLFCAAKLDPGFLDFAKKFAGTGASIAGSVLTVWKNRDGSTVTQVATTEAPAPRSRPTLLQAGISTGMIRATPKASPVVPPPEGG